VLEYDSKPTGPTPEPATASARKGVDPELDRARAAYRRGNGKLFSGDVSGAEAAYKEALAIYPGYISGYRGLGLAYERAGRTKDAIAAFHVYLRTVPLANDADLIRQRVARLEKRR
jgi:tetratricopeptide (TPR) repeat protein